MANENLITNSKIELITTDGKLILSETNELKNSIDFDLENYPNAIYFLKIYTSTGIKVVKVVKQQ